MATTKTRNPEAPPAYSGTLLHCIPTGPLGIDIKFEFAHAAGDRLRAATDDAWRLPQATIDDLTERLLADGDSAALAALDARLADAREKHDQAAAEVADLDRRLAESVVAGDGGTGPAGGFVFESDVRGGLRDARQRLGDHAERVRLLTEARDKRAAEVLESRRAATLATARETAAAADRRRQQSEERLAALLAQAVAEVVLRRAEAMGAGSLAEAFRNGKLPARLAQ